MAKLSLILTSLAILPGIVLAGSICNNFPYVDLLFLEIYPPAESFCSMHYPLSPTTVTITVSTATPVALKLRNLNRPSPKITTTTTAMNLHSSCDENCQLWSSCTKNG